MNVSLPSDLEQMVRDKVTSGRYGSASDVLREALRLLKERDVDRRLALASLKKDVAAGLEQLDCGQGEILDMEAIKAEARRQLS